MLGLMLEITIRFPVMLRSWWHCPLVPQFQLSGGRVLESLRVLPATPSTQNFMFNMHVAHILLQATSNLP